MKYELTENNVRLLGRTVWDGKTRYLGFSYSGTEFQFTGTKAVATLWTDKMCQEERLKAWVAVFINDEEVPSRRFALDIEEQEYVLYESKIERPIKLRLVKLSEMAFGKVGIKALDVESSEPIRPSQPKKRRLEVIGDSITCGYGNEGICDVDSFDTKQENPYLGYAVQTAIRLDADVTLVSWSGIGILSSWTERDTINDEVLMPKLYPYSNPTLKELLGYSKKWCFEKDQPDVVIIHLGTNDHSYTKGQPERISAFGKAYYEFLKQVRTLRPQAFILCILGVMDQELYPEIERQVTRLKWINQDHHISSMCLEEKRKEEGLGTDAHPSLITHDKLARLLSETLQEVVRS